MATDTLDARPAEDAGPFSGADLRPFLGVFCAALLAFLALGAVLPVLPRYVRGPLGAGDVAVGFVIGSFAFSAVVARPFAGRAADVRGRRLVFVSGAVLAGIAATLYFVPSVPGLIAARLLLGVGDGCLFTAGATWTVDLAPPERRGRAIGLFGLAIWGGLAAGPLIGEGLREAAGYDAVWAFAAAAPLTAALVARRVPDRHVPHPHAGRGPLLPRAAIAPGISLALANLGYAALTGFIVLKLADTGAGHGAAVFTAFAVAVVAMRILGGTLPDRAGPRPSAAAGALAEAAGLVLVALSSGWELAAVGAIVMGAGFSLLYPSLALIVVNRVPVAERGAALGAFTAFFDTGMGLGAPLAGAIAATAGYAAAFWVAAAGAAAGGLFTVATAAHARARARDDAIAPMPGSSSYPWLVCDAPSEAPSAGAEPSAAGDVPGGGEAPPVRPGSASWSLVRSSELAAAIRRTLSR